MLKAYDDTNFIDPLHIAWEVDSVLTKEDWSKHEEVMRARNDRKFRKFWECFNRVNTAIAPFQEAGMGIIPGDLRRKWQKEFMEKHPKEVPF